MHPGSRSCSPRRAPRCAWVILLATEAIAAALALWRGPPLLGLPDSAWARAEGQADWRTLRLDALEERFETALALGEHAEIEPEVRAQRCARALHRDGACGGS